MSESRSLRNFLQGQSVLIVGDDDVVCSSLLHTILKRCDVWHVYLAVSNTGQSNAKLLSDERVQLVAVGPNGFNLGISPDDAINLQQKVSVVFHTGKINHSANLWEATIDNLVATQQLARFCYKIVNLKAVVHVSTAFGTSGVRQGKAAAGKCAGIPAEVLVQLAQWMTPTQLETVATRIPDRGNSFVLTKSLSETFVDCGLPVVIVRTTMVWGACSDVLEPYQEVVLVHSRDAQSDPGKLHINVVSPGHLADVLLVGAWYKIVHSPRPPLVLTASGIDVPAYIYLSKPCSWTTRIKETISRHNEREGFAKPKPWELYLPILSGNYVADTDQTWMHVQSFLSDSEQADLAKRAPDLSLTNVRRKDTPVHYDVQTCRISLPLARLGENSTQAASYAGNSTGSHGNYIGFEIVFALHEVG